MANIKALIITSREKEILNYLSHGHNSREIAEILSISLFTVDTHRRNMMQKMQARNTAHLIRRCFEEELLHLNSNGLRKE